MQHGLKVCVQNAWSYWCFAVVIAIALAFAPVVQADEAEEIGSPVPTEVVADPEPVAPDAPVIPEPVAPENDPEIEEEVTSTEEAQPEVEPVDTPDIDAPVIPEPVEPVDDEEELETELEVEASQEAEPELEAEEPGTPAAEVTEESESTGTPAPTESPSPEPTIDVTPVVTWQQIDIIACETLDGNVAGLGFGASATYRCTASANVAGDEALVAGLTIEWNLSVSFPDSVQLQLPADSSAQLTRHSGEAGTVSVVSQSIQSSGLVEQQFDIQVARTTCAVGAQDLSIQATSAIHPVEGVEVEQSGATSASTHLSIVFVPVQQAPVVEMSPVDFGTLKWDGTSYGSSTATSTVTVSNSGPCPIAQAHIVDLNISAEHPGMQPQLLSVDSAESGFARVGESGTALVVIPAGFDGTASFEVQFQLTPSNDLPVGIYLFDFDVSVRPE